MAVYPSRWATVNATVPAYTPPPAGQVFPSAWATANAIVPAYTTADWWYIIDGERLPLYVRDRLTPEQKRKALVAGEFFPDETTTGPYDESVLEVINGDVTLNQPGQVFRDKHVRGRISVTAPNVTIENCRIAGPATGPASSGLITATHLSVKNLLITDTEIAPQHPNDVNNCINGHDFTLRRVNAHHGVDIVGVIGQLAGDRADVTVEGSWLHDMVMFNTTSQSDNITHNDLIQWHGLKGLAIIGARLEAFCDPAYGVVTTPPVRDGAGKLLSGSPHHPGTWGFSAVMGSPARKLMGDFILDRSWVDGGAVGVNFGGPAYELFPDGGRVTDTAFGTDFRLGAQFGVLTKAAQAMTISGNHRWNKTDPFDTSTPFNPRRNG